MLVAQVVASVTPWRRFPEWAIAVIPVLDLVALGMLRLNPEASGGGILAVVPIVWLVWEFGLRGAIIVTVACFGLLGLRPPLLRPGRATLSRSILDPLVAALVGGVVWALLTTARDGEAEAARRSSELAAALEQLGHTRTFVNAIFESVDVGLVLLGKDGEYLAMNERHQDFMDLAFPEGHGAKAGQLGDVFAEDGVRRLAQHEMPSLRAARGEEYDDIRMWVGADPLTRRACSVSARSVRDSDGEFVGAALAYKDVTEFLRSMGVKDDFVAMVSHEFRTPLTSIHGYISLLLDDRDRLHAEDVHYLEVVARNTERLHRLVTDLLASAQHAGRWRSSGRRRTCARSSAPPSSPRDRSRGQEPLAHDRGAVVPPDHGGSAALRAGGRQPGQQRREVHPGRRPRVGRLSAYDDHIELAVTDTGIGIDPAERDRLFTRFFRTRDAEERSIQGSGSVCRSPRRSSRPTAAGSRWRAARRGSTFLVWLPLDLVLAEGHEQAREDLEMLAEIERLRIG